MATVDTTFTPTADVFPYQGPPDVNRRLTGIPRAEVYYYLDNESIAAVGAGDNQRMNVLIDLEESFTYVMVGLAMYVYNPTGTYNFETDSFAWLTDTGVTASRTWRYDMRLQSAGVTLISGVEGCVYSCPNIPTQVIRPRS